MKITVWGSRGSITTPGQSTIRYGGNTTCLDIRPREGGVIIVDAGSGIRLLGKKLIKETSMKDIYPIFFMTGGTILMEDAISQYEKNDIICVSYPI